MQFSFRKSILIALISLVFALPAGVWLFGSALALLRWVRHKAT